MSYFENQTNEGNRKSPCIRLRYKNNKASYVSKVKRDAGMKTTTAQSKAGSMPKFGAVRGN